MRFLPKGGRHIWGGALQRLISGGVAVYTAPLEINKKETEMANIEHENISDANLHQCKGVAGASAGAIIVANGAGSSATSDNANTPVNLYDNELRRPVLKDYGETVNVLGNLASGTHSIDLTLGNAVTATLTDNVTFTFDNPSATGKQCSFTLILTQDGTGSRLVTWPASVQWAGASTPVISTGVTDVDIFGFLTVDGGTTWFGFVGGLNFDI